jgi:hypothetical protein
VTLIRNFYGSVLSPLILTSLELAACYAPGLRLYRKFILTTEGMKNRPSPINISAGGSGTVGGKQFVVHP